jgi:hypothetical protein
MRWHGVNLTARAVYVISTILGSARVSDPYPRSASRYSRTT